MVTDIRERIHSNIYDVVMTDHLLYTMYIYFVNPVSQLNPLIVYIVYICCVYKKATDKLKRQDML